MNAVPEAFTESGVQLTLLILGWVGVALIVLTIAAIALEVALDLDEMGMMFALFSGRGALIIGCCWIGALVPFDSKYQHYYSVTSEVVSVTNAFADDGGELTRQPVVVLTDVDRPLVIDDPRATTLKAGEVISLRCSIEWNYQSADSYSCRIVAFGGAR